MPKAASHTHRLKRHTYSTGTRIYFCTLPDCYFKIAPELALGKKSICNRCGNEFIMNKYAITLEKPHCENCHIYKSDKAKRRSDKKKRITDNMPNAVISRAAKSTVDDLRERLNQAASGIVTSENEELKAVEYRIFNEDDEL